MLFSGKKLKQLTTIVDCQVATNLTNGKTFIECLNIQKCKDNQFAHTSRTYSHYLLINASLTNILEMLLKISHPGDPSAPFCPVQQLC